MSVNIDSWELLYELHDKLKNKGIGYDLQIIAWYNVYLFIFHALESDNCQLAGIYMIIFYFIHCLNVW